MLPRDELFLAALQAADVDGQLTSGREKEILLVALRFYFGPAQEWNKVVQDGLGTTKDELKGRYKLLEDQTSLDEGYFAGNHKAPDKVKLYVAIERNNNGPMPSFHLYEARYNLTLYVGPDFLHQRPEVVAINTIVLNAQYEPVESHTLDIVRGPSE